MVALLLALCIVIRYLFRQEVALLLFTELANQQLPGVQTTEQWEWPMFGVCGNFHRVCLRAGKAGYLLERDLPVAKQTPVSLLWQESSRVLSLAQYLLCSLSNQPQHRERSTDFLLLLKGAVLPCNSSCRGISSSCASENMYITHNILVQEIKAYSEDVRVHSLVFLMVHIV